MVQCHQWCTSGTAGLPKCRGGWTLRLSEIISFRASASCSIDLLLSSSTTQRHARTCPGSRRIARRARVCARSTTTGCRRRPSGVLLKKRAASSAGGLRLGRLFKGCFDGVWEVLVTNGGPQKTSQLALKVLVPRWRQQVRTLRASENTHYCILDRVACARDRIHSHLPSASSSNARTRCNHCKKHSHR